MFLDNRGRLFGKINVIDFLVILFIVGTTIPASIYVHSIFTKKPSPPPDTTHITIEMAYYRTLLNKEVFMDNLFSEHPFLKKKYKKNKPTEENLIKVYEKIIYDFQQKRIY